MPILSRQERMDIAKHYGFKGSGGLQLRRFLDNNSGAAGTIAKRQGHVTSGKRSAGDYTANRSNPEPNRNPSSGATPDTGKNATVAANNLLGNAERREIAGHYGWQGNTTLQTFFNTNKGAMGTLNKRQGHVTSGKRTASDYTQNRAFRENQVLSGFERRDVARAYGYDGKSNLINFFQDNKGAFGTIQKRRQQVASGQRTANQYLENNYPGRFQTVTARESGTQTDLVDTDFPNPNKGTNDVPGDVLPKKGGQRSGSFDQNKALNPGARGGVRRRRLLG